MAETPPALTILLAEDDPDVRATTTDLLEFSGATVHAVASGREASRFLEVHPIDLLITDMIMPDGDGAWLLDFVRSSPQLHRLKVIMISAHAGTDRIAAGLRAGADIYVTKPYDPEKFLATVCGCLESIRRERGTPT